jgi:hypothetical protein
MQAHPFLYDFECYLNAFAFSFAVDRFPLIQYPMLFAWGVDLYVYVCSKFWEVTGLAS